MSRYTEGDLKRLNRLALLQLVLRQPNVEIPRKLTTQSPTTLTKDKLRKLLTGPFGFVKDEPIIPEQCEVSTRASTRRVWEGKTNGQAQRTQEEVVMGDQMSEVELTNPSSESDRNTAKASKLVDPFTNQQSGINDTSDQAVSYSNTSKNQSSGVCNDVADHPDSSTCIPIPSSDNDTTTPMQGIESLIQINNADESEHKFPSSLQAILASFPPDVSTAVREYFINQPQELTAWESIDLARNKKKPDFAVIRYIRQVLTLHDRLKSHAWPTDTGTLKSKDVAKILGFSSPWFTNARHVLDEYNKVGPESGRANDAIKDRFQNKAANKKRSDLLSFLRGQRKIIELETV